MTSLIIAPLASGNAEVYAKLGIVSVPVLVRLTSEGEEQRLTHHHLNLLKTSAKSL